MSRIRTTKRKRMSYRAGRDELTSLPALSSLRNLPYLIDIPVHEEQHVAYEELKANYLQSNDVPEEELVLACVVRLDRSFPVLATEYDIFRAEFAAQISKRDSNSQVALGDLVVARLPEGHDIAQIIEIVPRRRSFGRWMGNKRASVQTLAANIDEVIIVQAEQNENLDINRIVRSALIALDSELDFSLVISKCDLISPERLEEQIRELKSILGENLNVFCLGNLHQSASRVPDFSRLESYLKRNRLYIMLGESGAGKSTLINALLHEEILETGETRKDQQGRHTTVARRMVELANGCVVIDAPGLRNLSIVSCDEGLRRLFPELVEASFDCKFRDCTHTHEPGCHVLEVAREDQRLSAQVSMFVQLDHEMREAKKLIDPDINLNRSN